MMKGPGSKETHWSFSLSVFLASGCGDTLTPQSFALFATAVFARLLITFLEFQTFKQAIVLNLFL